MFDREYEIVRLVARHSDSLWRNLRGDRVLRAERGYGRGVADLVVLEIDRIHLDDRRRRQLPPARRSGEAAVLEAVITHAGEPLSDLLSHTGMTRSHARHLLSQLSRIGLVTFDDSTARPTWPAGPITSRVIAVEAKLSDWRGAAIQAARYLDFADEAYIAMPASKIELLLKRPERIDGLGLGLISVSDDGCSLALEAQPTPPRLPALRRWLEEAEYGELIGDTRRLVRPFPARFAHPAAAELVAI